MRGRAMPFHLGRPGLNPCGYLGFFQFTMGSLHHQEAVLAPGEKLHGLISDAQFFFQNKTKQLSSGTSTAT